MEYWYEKRMLFQFKFTIRARGLKIDFIPPNPVFQYSIIPLPLTLDCEVNL
jgi:hypothetical protein